MREFQKINFLHLIVLPCQLYPFWNTWGWAGGSFPSLSLPFPSSTFWVNSSGPMAWRWRPSLYLHSWYLHWPQDSYQSSHLLDKYNLIPNNHLTWSTAKTELLVVLQAILCPTLPYPSNWYHSWPADTSLCLLSSTYPTCTPSTHPVSLILSPSLRIHGYSLNHSHVTCHCSHLACIPASTLALL